MSKVTVNDRDDLSVAYTPGVAEPCKKIAVCTAEACSLRDRYTDLQGAGYEVVGVSKDSAASHVKFKEKHALPFPLIADINHELLEAMGAWGEKTKYGKKTMGTIRTTFLINEEGIIEQFFSGKQVNTKDHATQILQKD